MERKSVTKAARAITCLLFVLQAYSVSPAEGESFPPGSELPHFTLGAPDSPEVQKYLGLKNHDPFELTDIAAKMILIDLTNSA